MENKTKLVEAAPESWDALIQEWEAVSLACKAAEAALSSDNARDNQELVQIHQQATDRLATVKEKIRTHIASASASRKPELSRLTFGIIDETD